MVTRVLDAWHELLAEQGYGSVTLADVAARCGMSRSSLYRYVPDKLTLFQLLIDREVQRFHAELAEALAAAGTPARQLEVYVERQLAYFARQRLVGYDMSAVLTTAEHVSVMEHLEPVRRRLVELLEAGVASGEFRPLDLAITANLMMAVIASHQMALARGEAELSVVEAETISFVRGAVRADPRPASAASASR